MSGRIVAAIFLIVTVSTGLLLALKPGPDFHILYPLETTHQSTHIYNGLRYLSLDKSDRTYAAVLNNPIRNRTYADILILSGNTVAVDIDSARTRNGEAGILKGRALTEAVEDGEIFETLDYPKLLTPRMQAFGCAPRKTENTITEDAMDKEAKKLLTLFQAYRAAELDTVTDHILHNGTSPGGGIFRIRLPEASGDTPLIVRIKADGTPHTLRFLLQQID